LHFTSDAEITTTHIFDEFPNSDDKFKQKFNLDRSQIAGRHILFDFIDTIPKKDNKLLSELEHIYGYGLLNQDVYNKPISLVGMDKNYVKSIINLRWKIYGVRGVFIHDEKNDESFYFNEIVQDKVKFFDKDTTKKIIKILLHKLIFSFASFSF
jgi:hypothetical protein